MNVIIDETTEIDDSVMLYHGVTLDERSMHQSEHSSIPICDNVVVVKDVPLHSIATDISVRECVTTNRSTFSWFCTPTRSCGSNLAHVLTRLL